MKKLFLFVAVVVGFVALTALPAFAHAALEQTSPTDGQTFPAGQPPKSVTLQFSEGVQVANDGIRVLASSGNALNGTGTAAHGANASTVTMTLPAKMADGTYVVDWRVVSADSHPINGAFTFTVGKATASASDVAGLLKGHNNRGVGIAFGLTRALAFGSVLTLLGGIVFIRVCSSDAGDDQGVRSLLWISWAVAFVTSFVGIGMQAAYTTGRDISGMWNSTALGNVLDERFGQSWLLRAGLLLLVLPALYKPSRKRAPVANVVDAIVALLVLSTFTFAEHARTGRWIPLATVTDLVHLSSAAVWLGGVAVLATLLARRVVPRETPEVTQRFSRIAAPAIAIIAISGVVQAFRQTDGLNSLFDTTYGRLLLTKVGLVVMIVAAASVSRHIVRLWVSRQLLPAGPGAMRSEADPEDIRELRNAVVVEVALAIVVLLVTAVLVNTAPARVESAVPGGSGGSVATPVNPAGYSATLSNAGIKFAIRISPGVSGTNQMTVVTTKDGKPFDPIDITATLTQTAQNAKLAVPLKSEGKGTGTARGNVDLPIAGKYRLELRALYTDVDEAVVTDDVQIL